VQIAQSDWERVSKIDLDKSSFRRWGKLLIAHGVSFGPQIVYLGEKGVGGFFHQGHTQQGCRGQGCRGEGAGGCCPLAKQKKYK